MTASRAKSQMGLVEMRHWAKALRFVLLSTLIGTTAIMGCKKPEPPAAIEPDPDTPTVNGPVHLASEHLPNPVLVHQRVVSGGLPEGDAAFQELSELGIKTIISVDGMTPDVATARKFGLKYVHLPHGYDGIPQQRVMELAKAVSELEGPIYIHCHHGKHRSPAAASVACVAAGLMPTEQAVAILKLAGTDPNYKGLYAAAEDASKLDAELLKQLEVEFHEVQEIPPMATAMVQLSHAHDHLKLIAASNWSAPSDHPDLDPAHEALLMREIFTELLRTDEVAARPDDFRGWLRSSEAAARQLETAWERWQSAGAEAPPRRFTELAEQITSDCKACHLKYRDVPQRE